ncbi:MAG: ADOP family duplicated permease [Acidobacteriota bacterium]
MPFTKWVRAYRRLLDLYPPSVDAAERDEMAECLDDLLNAARGRAPGASTVLFARALAHLPLDAVRARVDGPPTNRLHSKESTMNSVLQDIKLGVRGLGRSPGFAFLAAASLALGVGANTTILGMVSSALWTQLPVPDSERIVRLFETNSLGHGQSSYANYRDVLELSRDDLDGLFLHRLEPFGLQSQHGTSVIFGELVSGTYFDTLRMTPERGRFFTAKEVDHTGAAPRAVVSFDLWKRAFGGREEIVGETVRLNDREFEVVAVAPRDFDGTKYGLAMDLWVPIWAWADTQEWTAGWDTRRASSSWRAVARLRRGETMDSTARALEGTAARLEELDPETNRDLRLTVFSDLDGSISPHVAGIPRLIGWVAIAGSMLVLLVACANVASLLFARAIGRRQEVGIRFALGSGRLRLIRQLLTESLLLALLGGAGGIVMAALTSHWLMPLMPELPYRFAIDPAPDLRVVAMASAVALLSALLFGLAPALQASATKPLSALRGVPNSQGARPHRGLSVVVVAMVSFSLVTVVMTGLFLRSLDEVRGVAPGFSPEGRVFADYDVSLAGDSQLQPTPFAQDLLALAEDWPGVRSAAVSSALPLADWSERDTVFADDRVYDDEELGVAAWRSSVTSTYFQTLGTNLVSGRAFHRLDTAETEPVVIVNETLAGKLWPDGEALGRSIRLERLPGSGSVRVVGVVADGKYNFLNEKQQAAMFRPWAQSPRDRGVVVVDASSQVATLLPKLPELLEQLDPRVPILSTRTLEDHVSGSLWLFRLAATLAGVLGLLALGLSAAGLYGVMAYAVSQRKFELGVRTAIGASQGKILTLILGRGLRLAGAGLVLGVLLSLGLGSVMANMLFGVSPRDPLTLLLAVATLLSVSVLASLLPALRVSSRSPVEALRPSD